MSPFNISTHSQFLCLIVVEAQEERITNENEKEREEGGREEKRRAHKKGEHNIHE
jgi:hypothetical protein